MPWLHAHNEDISSFLKRVFEGKVGISDSLIQVDMSGRPVRGIPTPGEIYFVSAGFPCPGYSLANSNPQADDIKTHAHLTYLGHYRALSTSVRLARERDRSSKPQGK